MQDGRTRTGLGNTPVPALLRPAALLALAALLLAPLAQAGAAPADAALARPVAEHGDGAPSPKPRAGWRLSAALAQSFQALPGWGVSVAHAQSFPALTGRVVDAANLLPPDRRAAIEAKLRAHEERSTNQVVVATVPSLGGYEIEEYANRLYRHWQLGTREKSNGALLLVAPQERKVRIEVGYGLEGTLTDALSKIIIATAIAPRFRQNDFAGGLDAGVDAVLTTLTGDAAEWQRPPTVREDTSTPVDPVMAFIFLLILFFIISRVLGGGRGGRAHRNRRGGWIVLPSGGWGGGWSGGGGWGGGGSWGGGGGGFSGRGGSSGGGGASGSW